MFELKTDESYSLILTRKTFAYQQLMTFGLTSLCVPIKFSKCTVVYIFMLSVTMFKIIVPYYF